MIIRPRKMARYFPCNMPNPRIWQEIWIIIQEKGKIFGFGFFTTKIDIQLFYYLCGWKNVISYA
jgi:hypothetical protein